MQSVSKQPPISQLEKGKYLLIPVELCQYVCRNRLVTPFRLFIYLKTEQKPFFKLSDELISQCMADLSIKAKRTITAHLTKLFELKWIRQAKATDTKFISGFDWIREQQRIKSKSAVKFYPEYLPVFRDFIRCTVINHMVLTKEKERRSATRKKRRAHQAEPAFPSFYKTNHVGFSNEILAKRLGVSPSTITNLKKLGNELKMIETTPCLVPLKISPKFRKQFVMAYPELASRVRYRNGKLYLQSYDKMNTLLLFKNRRKKIVP